MRLRLPTPAQAAAATAGGGATGARQVPCPRCQQPALFSAANRWRPFCSERCQQADFGAWAREDYRVAADAPPDEDLSRPPSREA